MSFWINYTGRRDEYPLPDGDTNRGRLGKKTMTANKGAAEIRSSILRKMRELDGVLSRPGNFFKAWEELRHYIKGMAKRASSKKGGLGRR